MSVAVWFTLLVIRAAATGMCACVHTHLVALHVLCGYSTRCILQLQGLLGCKVEQRVLESLVAKKLPKVAAHFTRLDSSVTDVTSAWFSTLFTTVLPAETTARVWDALLLEGNKVLLRTALALLKRYELTIMSSGNAGQLKKILDSRLARLVESDALMTAAFKSVGAMPHASINGLRSAARQQVEVQLEQHRQRLALVICRAH